MKSLSKWAFIVGYMGNKSNNSGNTMMAPTFLAVGSETGCTLADLTVTGYDAPVLIDAEEGDWDGGCSGGDFILNFLTGSGTLEARYYWIDNGVKTPGWYTTMSGDVLVDGSSISVEAGQGVWILGRGMTLQAAGQVNTKDVVLKTKSGNTACGNSTPVDLTLAKLTVTGYDAPILVDEEEGDWEGGCSGGDFILNFLNPNGKRQSSYYWIDDGVKSPGWYATISGDPIVDGASSVSVAAGQGVWVLGRGMYLRIPAPEL